MLIQNKPGADVCMKKFLWLIIPILIFIAYISYNTENQDVYVIPVEGTEGVSASEGFENIFDSNTDTVWSVNPFEGAYVIWELSDSVRPSSYIMVSSANTSRNKGCIPESWRIYASAAAEIPERKSDTWVEIAKVENDTVLNSTRDLSERYFYINADKEYRYYMLVIDKIESGEVMQLAEFSLQYIGYDYSYLPTGTRPHTTRPVTTVSQTTTGADPYTTTDPFTTTGTNITTTTTTYTTAEPTATSLEEMAEKNSSCYFYKFLTENEKLVYNQICLAVENYDSQISAPAAKVLSSSMGKVHSFFMYDHPEYFWVDRFSWHYDTTTQQVTSVEMVYCYPQSQVPSLQQKIDSQVAQLCAGIAPGASDYEIVSTLYDGIIELVDYDTLTLNATQGVENAEDEPDELRNIVGTFINKKVVCAGYAKAMQYILYKYGIECAYISNEDHAWNLVKMDGEYYYVDATWGDPSNTDPEENGDFGTKYSFLGMTTDDLEAIDSHEIPNDITVPECTATEYNYYVQNDLVFDYYDTDKLQQMFNESLAAGGAEIDFRCADQSTYEEMVEALFDDSGIWDYVNEAIDLTGATEPDTVWNVTDDGLFTVKIYYTY